MKTGTPGSPPRSLSRRVLRRLGWLVGAPLAMFRFLTRKTSIETVSSPARPVELPAAGTDHVHRGDTNAIGPVVHRVDAATSRTPTLEPERLLSIIAADPNVIAPSEVLRFERVNGEWGDLRVGEELRIRMAGPWDGPARVTHRSERKLRLAAIGGNVMHGQVEVRVGSRDGDLVMEIQTREQAGRHAFHLLQRVGLTGRMQLHTWAAMLENAARVAGACRPDRVTVQSWRSDRGGS